MPDNVEPGSSESNPFASLGATGTPNISGSPGSSNMQVDATPYRSPDAAAEGQTGTAPAQPTEPSGQPAQPSGTPAQPTTPVEAPAKPGMIQMTPAELAEFLKNAGVGAAPGGQQQQQGPRDPDADLTQEQINQKYSVVQVAEDDITTIFRGGEEGTAKLQQLLHNAATMGAKISAYHILPQVERALQTIKGQYTPAVQHVQQTEAQKHATEFFRRYDGFDPQKHSSILLSVYDRLVASGYRGSADEVYDKIAQEATNMLSGIIPGFQAKRQQQQPNGTRQVAGSAAGTNQQQTLPPSQMAQVTTTAGSGSGASPAGAGGADSTAKTIFGRMG